MNLPTTVALLERHLADPGNGWSMGSFGAIAEFRHDPDEPSATEPLMRVTDRGGIRLSLPPELQPVACETLSPRAGRWGQALMLCLPTDAAAMKRRDVLTELGPDREALRVVDQSAVLFDMGLAQPQVDFCIRTANPDLVEVLRAQAGRPLMEPGNPAMGAILAAHPHRVALTRLGRVEVFQKIGGPDTGGVSPPGPHTHVLPQLLRAGRTHSANQTIPAGLVPCAGLYPASPFTDAEGREKPYDPEAARAWTWLYERFGPSDLVMLKTELGQHLRAGVTPDVLILPEGREQRRALRVGIRQAARDDHFDAELVRVWSLMHDGGIEAIEDTPERLGH
ncbi:hypothetical protein JI664_07595 [Rhodobacter sp. NTK016B]|uniref:DUF6925 family protein n=1 Tax=Rhodobacter sp. NTK016B TaxID=2759676 RepID=UPI001A8F379B|nr:hypothetical protein [Rhodobacter sp. NTK016B]MBN8291824.1 hypothetical protein [Rhodobacter sp. NTK016B]